MSAAAAGGAADAPDDRFWVLQVALLLAGLAIVAGLAALVVHGGCTDPGPPVDRPEPGTSRAAFCNAENGAAPLLLWFFLPLLVEAVGATLLIRRHPGWAYGLTAVLAALVVANAVVVSTLPFRYVV
jgi:hypothetical protein